MVRLWGGRSGYVIRGSDGRWKRRGCGKGVRMGGRGLRRLNRYSIKCGIGSGLA